MLTTPQMMTPPGFSILRLKVTILEVEPVVVLNPAQGDLLMVTQTAWKSPRWKSIKENLS